MQQPSLLNDIVHKNHSGLSTADFLKQVSRQHPYFIPAQFYLLQQMPVNDTEYNLQAAKTAVLFNNPHWLHFKLQQPVVNPVQEAIEIISTATLPPENQDNDDDIAEVPVLIATPETIPVDKKNIPENEPVIEAQAPTAEQLMLAENADNDDDFIQEEEIAPMKITIPAPVTPTTTDDTLSFEPMHLVDYFASQGIKLSDEVQTADKLGKQLKSFTDWLKTMKKIHNSTTEANAGISDMVIQTLAAKSNAEGEIVTEAMAEVLMQQGKAGKAIEVYKKLSLLNPAKSAFFAAKIEQLKG
ncbi:hypothetical protein [Ferruginibacter sp.]|nr:hypothetical protein [Ferruginibacter sp.]